MMRSILGFLAGWVAMSLVVMGLFLLGPMALGVERVFEPERYEASTLWVVLAMGIGVLGGFTGGWVGARVGRGRGAVLALATVLVIASIRSAFAPVSSAEPAPRPPGQSVLEALQGAREHGREPLVTRVTNPLVGLIGLALGASLALRGSRRREG